VLVREILIALLYAESLPGEQAVDATQKGRKARRTEAFIEAPERGRI
jgi:hypothetical protein